MLGIGEADCLVESDQGTNVVVKEPSEAAAGVTTAHAKERGKYGWRRLGVWR